MDIEIIEVPIAAFAKKVLLKSEALDDDGAIKINENTLPGKSLLCIDVELPFPDLSKITFDTVKLKVSTRIASRYKRWQGSELNDLGAYYEKVAQKIIMSMLDMAVLLNYPQKDSLDLIYSHFGFEEWDYERESLLQLYKLQRTTLPRAKKKA
jgi:hypothetical protein